MRVVGSRHRWPYLGARLVDLPSCTRRRRSRTSYILDAKARFDQAWSNSDGPRTMVLVIGFSRGVRGCAGFKAESEYAHIHPVLLGSDSSSDSLRRSGRSSGSDCCRPSIGGGRSFAGSRPLWPSPYREADVPLPASFCRRRRRRQCPLTTHCGHSTCASTWFRCVRSRL